MQRRGSIDKGKDEEFEGLDLFFKLLILDLESPMMARLIDEESSCAALCLSFLSPAPFWLHAHLRPMLSFGGQSVNRIY
jgi:hypothetical protein